MKLCEQLAHACIRQRQKRAAAELEGSPSLEDVRSKFEELTATEQLARSHATRLKELAEARALREDTSPGGYAATAMQRLLPIPHTALEAGIRLPLTAVGGVGGYLLGREMERTPPKFVAKIRNAISGLDPEEVKKIFAPKGQLSSKSTITRTGLRMLGDEARDPAKALAMGKLLRRMSTESPETLAAALRGWDLPFMGSKATKDIRGDIERVFGAGGTNKLRQEVANLIAQSAGEKGVASKIFGSLNPYRVGGALAGLGVAGAATGIPYALRALYLKRQGGEAAVRARARVQEAISEAELAAAKREELLQSLPKRETA